MEVSPIVVEGNGGDTVTEFDWTDYNYEDNHYVPDNLDDHSDLDDFDAWNNIVNKRKEELLQQEIIDDDNSSSTSDEYSTDSSNVNKKQQRPGTPMSMSSFIRRTPPRVHFKQSMEEIFHKHRPYNKIKTKKGGILKNWGQFIGNEMSIETDKGDRESFAFKNDNDQTVDTENLSRKFNNDFFKLPCVDIDDDLTESIRQFDKYISEKVVRFAKKNKESKIKYLWSNLDIENKAQWENEKRRKRIQEKGSTKPFYDVNQNVLPADNKNDHDDDHEDLRKGEFHLPLIKCSPNYKTIRRFEKRNVTRTISKLNDLELLFIKNKPQSPDYVSNSDVEGDVSGDEGETRNIYPGRRGSLRRDSSEAIMSSNRGVRLKRAIRKVQKLLAAEKGSRLKKSIRNFIKENGNSETPRSKTSPIERFCHAGRMIILLLRAVGIKPVKPEDSDYNFLSWTILYDELGLSRTPYDPSGLSFDPQKFKASKESFLSHDVEDILLKKPSERTDAQIQQVIRFLSQVVPAFGEYPMRIQRSTLKCCTLERFEAGRVIIRQGHSAENFYFIISGTAVVTVMESGANHVHTVNSLTSGSSFGELAFLNMSKRTATVTCRENMELLCIERADFIEIFMRRIKGQEPEHMTFLRNVDLLKGWPIENLPLDNLRICAFTYVRRGVILSADSSKSDWMFVVVSGTCKILKAIIDLDISKEKHNEKQAFQLPSFVKRQRPEIRVGREEPNQLFASRHNDFDERRKRRKDSRLLAIHPPQRQPSAFDIIVNRSVEEVQLSKEEHLNQLDSIYQKRHVLPSIHDKQGRLESSSTEDNDNTSRSGSSKKEKENKVTHKVAKKKRSASSNVLFAPTLPIKPNTPSQFLRETTQNFGIQRSARSAARRLVVQSPGASTVHAWNTGPQVKKVFIEVARLEPGDVFGIEQLVMSGREDVTSTSLVSDGAEVIIIDKKFFRKHLTEETAKRIRKLIRPMPSESALQQNFINQKHWDAYKSKTVEGFRGRARHVQS